MRICHCFGPIRNSIDRLFPHLTSHLSRLRHSERGRMEGDPQRGNLPLVDDRRITQKCEVKVKVSTANKPIKTLPFRLYTLHLGYHMTGFRQDSPDLKLTSGLVSGLTPAKEAREEFGCHRENLTYSKKLKKIHCLHCLHPLLMRKWVNLLVQDPAQTEN
ncbi:hypothetical protein AVEN_56481-1 [Araneus ventricosus]|uniref:Uncharacterized protein n=1 Tax=Araneus ventricosus TaxID=182803 RepID=A0A4Y2QJV4_ARAVE|nr:hypothetical protein AVEN_56481-1 [Araneus ventricosus]